MTVIHNAVVDGMRFISIELKENLKLYIRGPAFAQEGYFIGWYSYINLYCIAYILLQIYV